MGSVAARFNLRIDQGADFAVEIFWFDADGEPKDLTGYTAAMQIRAAYDSGPPMLSLHNGAGITLGGVAGSIAVAVDAADTEDLFDGVWDLEVTAPGGARDRLVAGEAIVYPQVTRDGSS